MLLTAEFFVNPASELDIDPHYAEIACETLVTQILSTKEQPWASGDISFTAAEDFDHDIVLQRRVDILLEITVTGNKQLKKEAKQRTKQIAAALEAVYGPSYNIFVTLNLIFETATVSNRSKLPNLSHDSSMLEVLDETMRRICMDDGVTLIEPDPLNEPSMGEREPALTS